ncbi:MAG: site-specific recombinase XerD [Nonlabens sp.]|jgi:site-specific recombinase XerD
MIMSIVHFVEMLKVKRYSQSTVNAYRSALILVKNRLKKPLENITEY